MTRLQQLEGAEVADRRFQCPTCGAQSSHPEDIANGYCGRCHAFTGAGEERWIDTFSCGHEVSVLVFVPIDRVPRIGESDVCRQCQALVMRTEERRCG